MSNNTIVNHIQLAEIQVGIQEHLIHTTLEMVGSQFNVGTLHLRIDAFPDYSIQLTGIERNVSPALPLLLGRGWQGQSDIQQWRSGMDGVHIEGEVLDFQCTIGFQTIQIIIIQGLHQLLDGEVRCQIEVGAAN